MPQPDALREFVIYRCVVGSRAFGLDDEESDTDVRGIYLPPAELHWSLAGVPEQLDFPQEESCFWELQKFLRLALNGNPNILECLYTPLVTHASPLARMLLDQRHLFLSKRLYDTFNGYAASQFRKLQNDLRLHGSIKWKHAMHLLRLLMSGIAAVRDGTIQINVGARRDELLAIKRGEVSFEEIDRLRLALHAEFEREFEKTRLPDEPDHLAANALLIDARRSMVALGKGP